MAEVLPAAEEEFWAWISRRKAGTGGGTALVPISSAKMPTNSLTGAQSQEIAVLAGALQEHGMSAEEAALLAVDLAEIRQNAGRDTQMLTEKEFYEAFEKGFNYDIMQEIRENYSDELKEELNSGRAREESKEDFVRRATEEGYTTYDRQDTIYGVRRVEHTTGRGTSGRVEESFRTEQELRKLGIQADVVDGDVLWNRNGITCRKKIPQAATLNHGQVIINYRASMHPKEIAGHEAFHLWKSGIGREEYDEIIRDNLIYASESFIGFQSKIAQHYMKKEIDATDDAELDALTEEIFAYISGMIHAGERDEFLRPMFRSYDAVKAAWYELIRKNR